ncbi:phospholipid scramblase 1-like isoform X1 [Ostrea edulis]|uniref:phospholipid scramblase 1-like isoform X1 n=1 Tax=Ostrea edulis TaxID=37623 RepID=UPI002094180A|nr:phospholipid scramblase 1-like isoform X1 [Ostrea edulis]XP_048744831.1 phospholipid scramblase 1-like isoform X1 [Ostrea edulis]XP_048744832.1 phospholipid scramblase 1-like isoform X1 [Ostrea edulis]XP_048744833.1 phospholipid scramblase 1-like isoform X1 [Ostrea edulis]XP_048744834.1 phospholipid scramblase 1-like isoform X1 [Ostrea edulis]XP_056005708.1 phospholipid scramblase 1-like isoform X1 [Ostrea edulis]XP_056005709.1 phospholipid scramblase 1-like isoform X1 [Ostrea edulis]
MSYPKAEMAGGGQPGAPVQAQPAAADGFTNLFPVHPAMPGAPGGWMQAPTQVPANCPKGLEYLAQVDQLLVKQKVEALEAFTGFETNNKYEILNSMGQRVFHAVEDTCCCTRNCCGSSRPFDMKILNNQNQEVVHLSRPLRCSSCWFPCCLQRVTVEAPPGKVAGYVTQSWSLCKPRIRIENANEETVLRIKGPCCQLNICGDIEFDVYAPDEETYVGRVTKQWSGLGKELFTDADNFGISFPLDLDVNVKATLLGAVFLLDFMFFENNTKKDDKMDKHSMHGSY